MVPYTPGQPLPGTGRFLVAAALAIPLGIVMATSKRAEAFFEPFIDFVRYLPVTALIPSDDPLLWDWDFEKVAVIFVGTFFSWSDGPGHGFRGARRTPACGLYPGSQRRGGLHPVFCPLPSWYNGQPADLHGLGLGPTWWWRNWCRQSGLGFMILRSQRFLQTDRIFVGLLVIGLLGVATDYLFKTLSRILFPWYERLGH